ncbi:MAG: hypothetical protein LUG27_03605 [Clostridiales bacterium]|nr:hypothetical protein [Clostridiales bacterium]
MADCNQFHENQKERQLCFYLDGKKQILEFEQKIMIAQAHEKVLPEEQTYTIRTKQFQGKEPLNGECLEELMDEGDRYVAIKEDRYGDKVLYIKWTSL